VLVAFELVLAAEDAALAEDAVVVGFLDGAFHDFGLAVEFAADEDVGDVALGGEGGDGDAFEDEVGVVIGEVAVLEGTGLGLVEVDGHVVRALLFLGDEGPFLSGRESRAAASAQAGVDRGLDDLLGLHVEGFFERGVAAGGDVIDVPVDLPLGGVVGDSF
jgi:hypothetical protein